MATIILIDCVGQKGKLTDILAPEVQLCVLVYGVSFTARNLTASSFHLLPSGLVNPNCLNLIGSSVVAHIPTFFKELEELERKGLSNVHERIFISDRVHIDLDLHIAVDGLEEIELGERKVGTTGKGIGPAYSTKAARSGIRLAEVFNAELFASKLRRLASGYQKRYGDLLKYNVDEELARFNEYRPKLAKYTIDAVAFMKEAQEKKMKILCEGANVSIRDKQLYWVCSPRIIATWLRYCKWLLITHSIGGIVNGLSLDIKKIDEVIGVVKSYTTRVGSGAFKTEDLGEIGHKFQERGREWVGIARYLGSSSPTQLTWDSGHYDWPETSMRLARCVLDLLWYLHLISHRHLIDLVVVKYTTDINHYTALNLTKLDVLDDFPTIKIAIAYKDPDTGEEIPSYPADLDLLDRSEVIYHEMPGWNKSTTNAKTFDDLPKEAQDYVKYIEDSVGVKIKWIGTGPDREAMIKRF
ncbi:hypothetical protein CP533_4085 [Ophiocordyceps camponoti-saundersi (nom. inval.)]|nr:hypothetical protein CP533_4085 [Ophiocordyceps camponoti-saundersi (nom. inval.)]